MMQIADSYFFGLMHSGMRRTLSVSLLCTLQYKQLQEELEKRIWVRGPQ